ncbi:MAG: hypothetical protein WB630_02320, partial [Candidatus Acidiferrales bacterium]
DFADSLRVIQTQPVSGAGSAIVRANVERLMTQMTHYLNLVLSHRPEGVIRMTLASCRPTRITISAEIGQNDAEPFRKAPGNLVPTDMCLWITMKKQQRRAGSRPKCSYCRLCRRDILDQESGKQERLDQRG